MWLVRLPLELTIGVRIQCPLALSAFQCLLFDPVVNRYDIVYLLRAFPGDDGRAPEIKCWLNAEHCSGGSSSV